MKKIIMIIFVLLVGTMNLYSSNTDEIFYGECELQDAWLAEDKPPTWHYLMKDGNKGWANRGIPGNYIVSLLFGEKESSKFGCINIPNLPEINNLNKLPKVDFGPNFCKLPIIKTSLENKSGYSELKKDYERKTVNNVTVKIPFAKEFKQVNYDNFYIKNNDINDFQFGGPDQRCFYLNSEDRWYPKKIKNTELIREKDIGLSECTFGSMYINYDWLSKISYLMENNGWKIISTDVSDRKNHLIFSSGTSQWLNKQNYLFISKEDKKEINNYRKDLFDKLKGKDFLSNNDKTRFISMHKDNLIVEISWLNKDYQIYENISSKANALIFIYENSRYTFEKNNKKKIAKPNCSTIGLSFTKHWFGDYSDFTNKINNF